ncbi:MAG: DUF4065 domain-containing protein [Deltaproteobacteria bacterium]|nr:DUF4065 domain-containing protein [Deltaproteobacteria bacterium]
MATVLQVAEYFLTHNNPLERGHITALKLQKLVYYAQGHALATLGRPLFDELIHAWEHGPVCTSLYHRFKNFESEPLDYAFETVAQEAKAIKAAKAPFSGEELDLLANILACYGIYTAGALRGMSYETHPWQEAFPGRVISRKAMKDFFARQLKADKVEVIPLSREEADEIAARHGIDLQ